jgi:hypothetical protein
MTLLMPLNELLLLSHPMMTMIVLNLQVQMQQPVTTRATTTALLLIQKLTKYVRHPFRLFAGFLGFFAGFIASINCVVLDNVGMLLLCFIVGFICIVSEASGKLKLFSASYHIIFMSQIFMSENVKKIDVKKIVHYNR